MGKPKLTQHVQDQVRKMNQQGIKVTISDILYAVNNFGLFPAGVQTRVQVKNLGKRVTWNDNGTIKSGDLLIAMVDKRDAKDDGRIVTVITRCSWQDCSTVRIPKPTDKIFKKG